MTKPKYNVGDVVWWNHRSLLDGGMLQIAGEVMHPGEEIGEDILYPVKVGDGSNKVIAEADLFPTFEEAKRALESLNEE